MIKIMKDSSTEALCTVLDSQSRLPKITIAWLFSTLWLAACVWWLYIALHHYGGLPVAITVLALFLLCGGLALYYAAALWVYVYCTHPFSKAQKAMVFAACWTLAELARAQWWTGFPWAAIGYAHVDGVLSYAAPWTGIYGLCFLSALLSSALAQSLSFRQKTLKHWSIWAAVVIACLPAVRDTHTAGPSLSVNLLQANISQDTKFREARLPALQWYQTALFDSTAELTVMPETALPYFKDELPPHDRVIYTGPIDKFYGYKYGHLEYKTVSLDHMRMETPNYQGVAAINYTSEKVPFTRTIEHKHFENSQSDVTWVSWETPIQYVPEKTEPYYPVNDAANMEILKKYKEESSKQDKVIFGGRLGEYKYYDMHQVIRSALDCANHLKYLEVWHPKV